MDWFKDKIFQLFVLNLTQKLQGTIILQHNVYSTTILQMSIKLIWLDTVMNQNYI